MATYHRKKEALRIAVYAFVAGSHRIIEEVERLQGATKIGATPEAAEMRHAMLDADYERLFESHLPIELFLEILNEEDLYPFGSEWPGEAFAELLPKIIPPKLNLEGEENVDLRIRFKKGPAHSQQLVVNRIHRTQKPNRFFVLFLGAAVYPTLQKAVDNETTARLRLRFD